MEATYTKIGGEWGVRVVGAPTAGDSLTVTKRSGESKRETIASVVSAANGVALCTIVATARAPRYSGRSSRYGGGTWGRGRCEDAPCCGCCS